MGAWGAGFLQNDTALDLVTVWDKHVAPCLTAGAIADADVWSFLSALRFRGRILGADREQNYEVLAVAALFERDRLPLTDNFKAVLEKVINAELRPAELREWEDSKERRKHLLALLATVGGTRKAMGKGDLERPDLALLLDALQPFAKRMTHLAHMVSPPSSDDEFDRLYPSYFDRLDETLLDGMALPRQDTDQESRLIETRFSLMAFYVGWKADCPAAMIIDLAKRAKATKGHFWINKEIFGDTEENSAEGA